MFPEMATKSFKSAILAARKNMKPVFLHIISIFLAACILANSASSWLYVEKKASQYDVVIDVQNQGLPCESREEKVKSLKDFSCKTSILIQAIFSFFKKFISSLCKFLEDIKIILLESNPLSNNFLNQFL